MFCKWGIKGYFPTAATGILVQFAQTSAVNSKSCSGHQMTQKLWNQQKNHRRSLFLSISINWTFLSSGKVTSVSCWKLRPHLVQLRGIGWESVCCLCGEQYFRSHAGVKSELTLVCWFLALTDGAIRPPSNPPSTEVSVLASVSANASWLLCFFNYAA